MKRIAKMLLLSGAAGLLVMVAPAWAQEGNQLGAQVRSNLREVRLLEWRFREAEERRLRGDCLSARVMIRVLLDQLHGRLEYRVANEPAPNLPPEVKADMERRAREFLAQDCPPGSGRPLISSPVTQPATEPTPAPSGQPSLAPSAAPPPSIFDGTDEAPVSPSPAAPAAPPPSIFDGTDEAPVPPQMSAEDRRTESLRNDALIAFVDHRDAAARCDRAAMAEAMARLEQAARETRQRLEAARAAGEFSTMDLGRAQAAADAAARQLAEARAREAQDCREPDQRVGQAGQPVGPGIQALVDDPYRAISPEQWLAFMGLVGETEVPETNYGFLSNGPVGEGNDQAAGFSEERVETFGFGLGASLPRIGEFSLGYSEGSADGRFDIPVLPGGGASGIVNTDESPSTSTGVTGNFGLRGTTEVSVKSFEGGYRYSFFDLPSEGRAAEPRVRLAPFVGVTGAYRERDHQARLDIATTLSSGFLVQVSQQLDQEVVETEFGVLIGFDAAALLINDVRFDLRVEAGAYHFDYDLRSLETRTQNIGPASDQSFTNLIEDGESGIGYSGSVQVGLGVAVDRQIELFLAGRASYFSDRAQVINPFSGDFVQDGGTTFLGTDDAIDWRVMAGIRFRWGEPPPPQGGR